MTTKKPRQPLQRPVNPRVLPCNYASLVGAIVGQSEAEVLAKFNMAAHPCEQCGQSTPRNTNKSRDGRQWHRFCSKQCRYDNIRTWVACDECGELFQRRTADLLRTIGQRDYQHVWCSKSCQGQYFGRVGGFVAHPEHSAKGKKKPKYDYEAIWQLHLTTGYGPTRLSQELNTPYGTISVILMKMRRQAMACNSLPEVVQ